MTPAKKLAKMRIQLLLTERYFGHLIYRLKSVEVAGLGTMATDGVSLFYDPEFVAKLKEEHLKTVLAHECLHPALKHHTRRGTRDPKLWNVAADYAVNLLIEDCNEQARTSNKPEPFAWPDQETIKPLLDAKWKGFATEAIYNALQQEQQQQQQGQQGQQQQQQQQGQQNGQGNGSSGQQQGQSGNGKGSGKAQGQQGQQGQGQGQSGQGQGQAQGTSPQQTASGMGDVFDCPQADQAGKTREEDSWTQAVLQAAAAAKGRGNIPGGMVQMVENILHPKASWQEVLREFVRERARDDYSWLKPSRRYCGSKLVLPSLYSQRVGKIAVVRDTSGSTHDWQAAVLAELSGIIAQVRPEKVILIDADAKVHRTLELDPTDPLPKDAPGGGGTNFIPALEALENYEPVCCVYITDLDGRFPKMPPSYPVLWATNHPDKEAPFGQVVRV